MAGILDEYAEHNKAMADAVGPLEAPSELTPSEQSLVSNQLGTLLSQESPYIQRARARATEYANSRGLLNSSIAATSGEAAAIDAALPIAQGDAETYGRADEFNATNRTNFARDANSFARERAMGTYQGVLRRAAARARLDTQRDLSAAEIASREQISAADLAGRERMSLADLAGRERMSTADLASRERMTAAELASRESMASNELTEQSRQFNEDLQFRRDQAAIENGTADEAARERVATKVAEIRQQAIQARASIESNPNMSAEAKAAAITALTQQASQDIRELIRVSGINIPDAWPDWINEMVPVAAAPAPATHDTFLPQNPVTDPAGPGGYGP